MKNQQCAFAQWRRGNHFTVTRGHFSKSLEECIHCRSNWVCCCVMCTKSRRWAAAAQRSFSSVQPKSYNSSPVLNILLCSVPFCPARQEGIGCQNLVPSSPWFCPRFWQALLAHPVPRQDFELVPMSLCPGTMKEFLFLCPEKLHCHVPWETLVWSAFDLVTYLRFGLICA